MNLIDNFDYFILAAVIFGLVSIYFFFGCLSTLIKLKLLTATKRLLATLFFTSITLFLTLIIIAARGYQNLTMEEPLANITIVPVGTQKFDARVKFHDGNEEIYSLNGDEVMIDASILKWKPWANALGLNSGYRLQRISGRYQSIGDEKVKNRTVFEIHSPNGQDIATWRNQYSLLSHLLDVEHGSASFVNASQASEYHLVVTTNGLLLRPEKIKTRK